MEKLKGIPASPGIYIGKVFLFFEENINIPKYKIEASKIEEEVSRLNKAFEEAKAELESLKIAGEGILTEGESLLLDTHMMMLRDPEFLSNIDTYLRTHCVNAETAVFESIKVFIVNLSFSANRYAKERISDFKDITRRVLGKLISHHHRDLSCLTEECIVVAHDILPSDAIIMDKKKVKGIALEAGGHTSHTAIIARAFRIPAVLGVVNIIEKVKNGDTIIIDGDTGIIIIDPDEKTVSKYKKHIEQNTEIATALQSYIKKVAVTNDGKRILVKANIEISDEAENVKMEGADGIGLFRSEFMLLKAQFQRNENKQFELYKDLLEKFGDQPVTIRTLDIGGDKVFPGMEDCGERNPLLGWRGIRFSLTMRDIFISQLRALYRASAYGNLRIMFPMISEIEELNSIFEIIEEVKYSLKKEGYEIKEDIPVGIMMEVPSAVIAADFFAEKVDFFSIGTNDLIQYTIAIDRGNERVAYMYQPFHPAILRMIKMTVDAGKRKNIPVSVCGEIAGDPLAAIVLLGLGIDELSMSSQSISVIKKIIRNVTFEEARETCDEIFKMNSGTIIYDYLRKKYSDRFGIYFK